MRVVCIVLTLLGWGMLLGCGVLRAQDSLLSKSDMVKLDFRILAEKRKEVRGVAEKGGKVLAGKGEDAAVWTAYQRLLGDADRLLSYGPVSVMDKTGMPPSGSKHDYMSIAPYFWPDPSKPDGLPYINKDGQVNPEVRQYQDKQNFPKLCEHVYSLALAYYFSGEEKYAAHASLLLRVWFLDPATKMNPNLNYGQAVKGVTPGRAAGLIDSRFIIWALDAVHLLQGSGSWKAGDDMGMKRWCADFLGWLQASKIGIDEMRATNNHGVWYDAQCLALAVYLDSTALADKIVLRTAGRLDEQMDSTGFFPRELARTTSLHYSVFILNAFFVVADLSVRTHTDLWTLTTKSGKSLHRATEVILPYLLKEKEWTGQQIQAFNFGDGVPVLLRSGTHYGCSSCVEAMGGDDGLSRLL